MVRFGAVAHFRVTPLRVRHRTELLFPKADCVLAYRTLHRTQTCSEKFFPYGRPSECPS